MFCILEFGYEATYSLVLIAKSCVCVRGCKIKICLFEPFVHPSNLFVQSAANAANTLLRDASSLVTYHHDCPCR